MDVHVLGRIGLTFGVWNVFIVTPIRALRLLTNKILEHWQVGFGATYNETRRVALDRARAVVDLDSVILEIERETGERPVLIATSVKEGDRRGGDGARRPDSRPGLGRRRLQSSPGPGRRGRHARSAPRKAPGDGRDFSNELPTLIRRSYCTQNSLVAGPSWHSGVSVPTTPIPRVGPPAETPGTPRHPRPSFKVFPKRIPAPFSGLLVSDITARFDTTEEAEPHSCRT